MPKDYPDFGILEEKAAYSLVADLGELAVRLGSTVEYDRRGDVVYLDDYESPLERFTKSGSGDCSAILDSTVAYSGAQCVKLATAGVINDLIEVIYKVIPIASGRHGSKITLAPYEMYAYSSKYEIGITFYDGTYCNVIDIELNLYAKTLRCQTGLDEMTPFETNFKMRAILPTEFANIKVVFDIDTGKYVRLLIDKLSWDISAYSFYRYESDVAPRCAVGFLLTDLAGHAFTIWQDNFVYTISEP